MATNQPIVPERESGVQRGFTQSQKDFEQDPERACRDTAIRAAQLLPRVKEEHIQPLVRYIERTSKHSLASTSFVNEYLVTAGRIIDGARKLLEGGCLLTDLQRSREALLSDVHSVASVSVPPRDQWSGIQESYEIRIRSLLSGLTTASEGDPELRLRALNLAIIVLKVQSRKEEFDRLIKGEGRDRLIRHKDLMDKAYRSVAQTHGENFSIGDRLEALVRLSSDRTGRTPNLRIFNDFDGNLTQVPESGSRWKPGESTNELLNTLDRAAGFPMFIRLVTTELPGLDISMQQTAATLYAIAAQESHLYEDVESLLANTVSLRGVQHNILTANHEGLVAAKLQAMGRSSDVELLAVGQLDWYESKIDMLLLEIMRSSDMDILLFADDNDGPVANHLEQLRPVLPSGEGVTHPVYLHDILFLASRYSTSHSTRVGDMLAKRKIEHVDLRKQHTPTGFNGFGQMQEFIRRYERTLADEAPIDFLVRYPALYSSGDSHIPGDVVRRCRAQQRHLHERLLLPAPEFQTVIKPLQDTTLVGSHQFDLGSTTAIYDSDSNSWIVLYKAASEPSGSRPMNEPSPSNVFAARFFVSEGRVEYFDRYRSSSSQLWMDPFLTSALPEQFSRDGLHDPRATTIANGPTYILACAFNKNEEQISIKEAAGDLSKPIRGAVTELFVTTNPKDPGSYESLGVFGPDFHFKNMVLFPERIEVNGKSSIVALCRKMPGIQAIPIPEEAFTRGAWSDRRAQFWNEVLAPSSIARYHVLAPELPHEGRFNPNAPGRLGQVAPGLTPIKVRDPRPGQENKHYWLMVYNSVPDFKSDANGTAKGRVIGAALLDYDNPWTVVARSPVPIITGRHELEVLESDGVVSRHPDVVFCGGGGVDPQGRLSIFYTEDDSIIRCATYNSVDELVGYLLKFDALGRHS